MVLLASAQAVDLRGCQATLGEGNRQSYAAVRELSAVLECDRALETDVARIAGAIRAGEFA